MLTFSFALGAAATPSCSISVITRGAKARQVPASEISRSRSLSNYGAYALVGAAGGMFLLGKFTGNDHAAETGFLASEAAMNAAMVDFALKSMFQRERPYRELRAAKNRFGALTAPASIPPGSTRPDAGAATL